MDELKRRLTKELQKDLNVRILESVAWSLPVHSLEVSFNTVKRTKMDILMKMMLKTFQKVNISSPEELSELLLVEQLFITDLINKMLLTQILEKRDHTFVLTNAGIEQLKSGIFEHEPENESTVLLFSPCHQSYLTGTVENGDLLKNLEQYRHYQEFKDWEVSSLDSLMTVNELKTMGIEKNEGDVQTVVSEITSTNELQIDEIPILEFRLYHKNEDTLYVRIWNTLTEQWDEVLEEQINERDRKEWRELYSSVIEKSS